MQLKNFFSKKYIIFYLAVFAFVFLLVATLAIGFKAKGINVVTTLTDLGKQMKDLGSSAPTELKTTFGLLVSGLVFSGLSLIFLCIPLFNLQKIGKYQKWIWLTGMILVLLSMIFVLAGEAYFGNQAVKTTGAKFKDIFDTGRFAGLIICITVVPLTTLILGGLWYSSLNKK